MPMPLESSMFVLPHHLAGKADPRFTARDEQQFAAIAAAIDHQKEEITGLLDARRKAVARFGGEVVERDQEIRRLSSQLGFLQRFGVDLCLGRMVTEAQEDPVYIGRAGLRSSTGEQLLIDWRAPAARPFFSATRADPVGLASRRRYRWNNGKVTDYWDEVFVAGLLGDATTYDDESAFVAINCAAIPENMLEATLFGYEKGAFTGAVQGCPGKFEQAQGGTLLLDEITEMDLGLQAKLLRVLQEKEVERLGSRKMIPLDVRVIATSNRDLKKAVQDGLFREDLYYRLNVFPLRWTSLWERPGDILPLAEHLLALHASQQGLPTPQLADAVRERLLTHPWPGNVRELDNVVQRALILCPEGLIGCEHLILEETDEELVRPLERLSGEGLGGELKQQEHQIILDTLQECNGSRKEVADKLGISPRTLRYKLAQMRDAGIELPA